MKREHRFEAACYSQLVSRRTHSLDRLELGPLSLSEGQTYEGKSEGRETGLVILTGNAAPFAVRRYPVPYYEHGPSRPSSQEFRDNEGRGIVSHLAPLLASRFSPP
jgi:hypothetical protein